MDKVKFGIIGCGRIFKKHIGAILDNCNAEIAAICDIDENRLQDTLKNIDTAASPGIHPETYTDYKKLLNMPQIDVVNICTPSGMHATMAIDAFKAKKNVIVEKPLAMHMDDAYQIVSAMKISGKSGTISLQNRLNPAIAEFLKFRADLGKLNYVSSNVFWYRDQEYYNDGIHGWRDMDGGVLMNQGTHYIDMLLYLSGKKISKISSFAGTFKHKMECEDAITLNLLFDDGTIGNIQANTLSFPCNFEGSITMFFDHATVKIGGLALNRIEYWKGLHESDITEILPQ